MLFKRTQNCTLTEQWGALMTRFLIMFMTLAGLSATGSAQTVWGIEAYSDVCRVVLVEDENRIGQGTIDHLDEGCRVGPFERYAVGNMGEVRFLGASGDILMLVMPDGAGYDGYVGDGDPVTMSVMSSEPARRFSSPDRARPPARPSHAAGGFGKASAPECVRYYDSRQCAQDHDLGMPGSRFDLLPIETRARMNKRFMANLNSSVEGQIEAGVCVEVRNCTERMIDEEIWCEVDHDGDWSWILKQDAQYVYAGAGCG